MRGDRFQTAQKIRELEHTFASPSVNETAGFVPIIALSATSSDEYRIKSKESGMDDYLCKPLKKEVLRRCLQKWCICKNKTRMNCNNY